MSLKLNSSGGGSVTLQEPTTASSRTLTLPDVDGTVLSTGSAITVANGGTGQTTYTDGQLLIGNTTGNTLTKATLTAGSGISITNGAGSVTITSSAAGLPGAQGQAFTSSGTFTIPTGVTAIKMTIVGGGGAGGSTSSTGVQGGGGGGGAAIKFLTGLTPGNTLTVTVGAAAGTSSVASGTQSITTVSATGGANATNNNFTFGLGGTGGVGSSGDLNIGGTGGGYGFAAPNTCTTFAYAVGGTGGSSILGGGGLGAYEANGNAGRAYGGGGGGSMSSAGTRTGGAGAAGVVLIEW